MIANEHTAEIQMLMGETVTGKIFFQTEQTKKNITAKANKHKSVTNNGLLSFFKCKRPL